MKTKDQTTKALQDSIAYEEEVKQHEERIRIRRFELDRMLQLMEFYHPGIQWSVDDIRRFMTSQIDQAESMDAPNKPGYYRANND